MREFLFRLLFPGKARKKKILERENAIFLEAIGVSGNPPSPEHSGGSDAGVGASTESEEIRIQREKTLLARLKFEEAEFLQKGVYFGKLLAATHRMSPDDFLRPKGAQDGNFGGDFSGITKEEISAQKKSF